MKKINVSKVGTTLIGDDAAKEVFIALLESYVQGDKDDNIELDFKSVLVIDATFFSALVLLCVESNHFTIDKFRNQLIFSGLFLKDIENLSSAIATLKHTTMYKDFQPEEVKKKLREMHDKRQKELWGNNPIVKEAFDKVSNAIEQAFNQTSKIKP